MNLHMLMVYGTVPFSPPSPSVHIYIEVTSTKMTKKANPDVVIEVPAFENGSFLQTKAKTEYLTKIIGTIDFNLPIWQKYEFQWGSLFAFLAYYALGKEDTEWEMYVSSLFFLSNQLMILKGLEAIWFLSYSQVKGFDQTNYSAALQAFETIWYHLLRYSLILSLYNYILKLLQVVT